MRSFDCPGCRTRIKLDDFAASGSVYCRRCVMERFGITVHPRSIQRALARREKKLRRPPASR